MDDRELVAITPRMAEAGKAKLIELGYEGVEFTDAQKVYLAMLEASPAALAKAGRLASEVKGDGNGDYPVIYLQAETDAEEQK